jgi:hypothetical protein
MRSRQERITELRAVKLVLSAEVEVEVEVEVEAEAGGGQEAGSMAVAVGREAAEGMQICNGNGKRWRGGKKNAREVAGGGFAPRSLPHATTGSISPGCLVAGANIALGRLVLLSGSVVLLVWVTGCASAWGVAQKKKMLAE